MDTIQQHFFSCRSLIWEKAFRPFMDERESKRKARERDQSATNASEKYTQVSWCLLFLLAVSLHFFYSPHSPIWWEALVLFLLFPSCSFAYFSSFYFSFFFRVANCVANTHGRRLKEARTVLQVFFGCIVIDHTTLCFTHLSCSNVQSGLSMFTFISGAPTTSQAVMAQQQSKASKKINYDALKVIPLYLFLVSYFYFFCEL